MSDTTIPLVAVSVTLLGSLIAVVWRAGALVATMTSALQELRAMVAELKEGLSHVRDFPIVRSTVESHGLILTSLASKVEALYARVFSLDKHRAVQQAVRESRPDPDERKR